MTGAADPAADLVGTGCAAYGEANPSGPSSIVGMSTEPVATAADSDATVAADDQYNNEWKSRKRSSSPIVGSNVVSSTSHRVDEVAIVNNCRSNTQATSIRHDKTSEVILKQSSEL